MKLFSLKNRSQKSNRKSGFTLLELLVVISIIGILIAMGAVAYTTVQRKGRDGKRRADMQQMQKAFEQYFADNGGYEACSTMASSIYMPGGLPSDPKPSQSYTTNCSTTAYCVCGLLEEVGTGNATGATGTACNFSSGGNYFCAQNLQ